MTRRLYADEYRCAIYDEAPGGGDPLDPNSLMNRPVLDPVGWTANIHFHSDFNYYSTVAASSTAIGHPAVPGAKHWVSQMLWFGGNYQYVDHLLATHNLGYVPKFFVAYDGKMIPHGYPIQDGGNTNQAMKRFVTAYATASELRLYEVGISHETELPAVSRTYQYLIFANGVPDASLPMLNLEPGNVIFGKGKFRSTTPPLRVVAAGESPFAQATSRTAAIANGALRVYPPNGAPIDMGNFNGFIPAPNFISVQSGAL